VPAAFVCAYPAHLGGIALSAFMNPGLPVLGLSMVTPWLATIEAWAADKPEVAAVWLFGSRAKGTERPDSDVDLGVVLMPGEPGHDWPLGNWMAIGSAWRDELCTMLGRGVSLEAFSRPGELQSEEEVAARAPAILLWTRPASTAAEPVSLSTR
jgi:predicted nucleotidyltransferase